MDMDCHQVRKRRRRRGSLGCDIVIIVWGGGGGEVAAVLIITATDTPLPLLLPSKCRPPLPLPSFSPLLHNNHHITSHHIRPCLRLSRGVCLRPLP